MNTQVNTAFYWLLLGVCFITHAVLHMYGLFEGVDIRLPEASGEVSLGTQVFNTIIFTLTLLLALLSLNLSGRGFRWFSLIWASLFALLNLMHLGETIFVEAFDLSQVCLLTFVMAVNVMLIIALWKSLKSKTPKT
jgi:hypothetical protein